MSRTPHASLFELTAAQLVQASQVFANTLLFDSLYARWVDHSPAPRSKRGEFSNAIESFAELQHLVGALSSGSKALLHGAGSMDLIRFAQERAQLKTKFDRLVNRAGVLHDFVLSAASMAPPDMAWAWRRLEVTDQHAQDTVTRVAVDVVTMLTKLIDRDRKPPSVIIDYRHFHKNRNITHGDKSIYLTAPFWAIYLPRVGAGTIAHECAHSTAKEILLLEVENLETKTTRFIGCLADIHALIASCLGKQPTKREDARVKGSTEVILGELLSDVLAAEILGPSYIVNLAENLIGTRRVQTDERSIHYVSPNLRIQLLLGLHETGRLAWSSPEPEFLLEQVRRGVAEYERVNRMIIDDRGDPQAAELRRDWVAFQDHLLALTEPAIEDLVDRRLLGKTPLSRLGHQSPFEIIGSARECRSVRTYAKVWQEVDEIARASSLLQEGHARALLGGLEALTEVRRFILDDDPRPDPAAPDDPARQQSYKPLEMTTGESWSLEWFWIRARPTDERERAKLQDPPQFERLGAWMMAFAQPSAQPQQRTRGIYGLILGASDGFMLRPFLRVRQEARLDANVHQRGLAAYVERRALVEIVELLANGSSLWAPGPWSESCFISELLLPEGRSPEEFLRDIVRSAGETGLELKRAFIGTGWMSFVLLFRPVRADWRSRLRYLGGSAKAPARSITSIICALSVSDESGNAISDEDTFVYPWDDCMDTEAMRVLSSLRVRDALDIFELARECPSATGTEQDHRSRGPAIYPTFGPFDGMATFSLESPKQLPDVARWLYGEIARGRLIRSVTSIPAEVLS